MKTLLAALLFAGLTGPIPLIDPAPQLTGFTSPELVAEHCPSAVVRVFLGSRTYYLPGSEHYGKPPYGGMYACKDDADRAGLRSGDTPPR
jgi:hypothetical protein